MHASLQKPKKKCAWVNEAYDSNWNSFWKLDTTSYKLAYCADAGMEAVTDKDSNGVAKNYVKSSTDLKNALADVDVIIDQTYDSDPAKNLDTQEKVIQKLGITLKQGAVLLRLDRELSDNSATSTKFYENNAGDSGINWAWTESGVLRPAHVLQGLVHAVWPDSVKEIPDSSSWILRFTDSFAIIWLTEKCFPTSRRKSTSVMSPSQSRLLRTSARFDVTSKSRKCSS